MYERERKEMVEKLVTSGYLRSREVIEAMMKVPRHVFVPAEIQHQAYYDQPLPVGDDQTISAPHMVAMMCDALRLDRGHKVLEVGAGTGYHACVIAEIVKRKVISIERVENLVKRARENLADAGCGLVEIIHGDGTKGYEKEAPYDRIIVTAGAPEVPDALVEQLKDGGLLLVPVGSRYYQELIEVRKVSGRIEKRSLGGCAFVPLVGEDGWSSPF